MKSTRKLLAAVAACATAAWLGTAQATDLILSGWVGGTFHQGVNVSGPFSGSPYTGQAGGFVGTWGGAPVQVWCYEIGQTFAFGTTYHDYTLGVPTNEDLLSKLFQEAYGDAVTSAQKSAAFQLAIWEILYDSDLDLFSGAGTFHTNRVGNATDAQAQAWLDGLGGFTDMHDIILYHSGEHQDFIGRRPPGDLPEPGSLALMGAGLVALLVAVRRRGDRGSRA